MRRIFKAADAKYKYTRAFRDIIICIHVRG